MTKAGLVEAAVGLRLDEGSDSGAAPAGDAILPILVAGVSGESEGMRGEGGTAG